MRSFLVATTTLLALFDFLSCSPEPLHFADWTIPVPEGTPIIEYAAVPMEERTERIELVEDLVIGREDDPDYAFYHPFGLVADGKGRVYVLDSGNRRIQVFDQDGDFVRTLGQDGQGPAELKMPNHIAIAGDRVVVVDLGNRRLSSWDLSGVHIRDAALPFSGFPLGILGFSDGSLMLGYTERNAETEDLSAIGVIARFSADREEVHRYATGPGYRLEAMTYSGVNITLTHRDAEMTFAVGPSDNLYFSTSEEYQVFSASPDGSLVWAMHVAWPAVPYPQARIAKTVKGLQEEFPEAKATDFSWPERLPVLAHLRTDGHGHLYVFPYVSAEQMEEEQNRPVDVYSPAGELLFSGMMGREWDFALGDHVYILEEDTETEEVRVVRYRLVEPF